MGSLPPLPHYTLYGSNEKHAFVTTTATILSLKGAMSKPSLGKRLKKKLGRVGDALGLRSRSPTPSQSSGRRQDASDMPDALLTPHRSGARTPTVVTGGGSAIASLLPSAAIGTLGTPPMAKRSQILQKTGDDLATPDALPAASTTDAPSPGHASQARPDTAPPSVLNVPTATEKASDDHLQAPQTTGDDITRAETSVPAPSTDNAPSPNPNFKKKVQTFFVGLQNVLSVVELASDVFPPLKSTLAAINALLGAKDAFSSNQEEFEKLGERVRLLDEILRDRSDEELPQEVRDRRDGLKTSIESLGRTLEEKANRDWLTRAAYTTDDQQEILRLVREITFTIELAMLDVTVSNNVMILKAVKGIQWLKERTITENLAIAEGVGRVAKDVSALRQDSLFRALGDIKGFGYTRGGRRSGCVPGTRITLLAQLLSWTEDPASTHAFWLSGIAGVGKTAVTETFCHELSNRGLLGASFFCSLTNKDLNDVYLILPSLARALARARPEFGIQLATTLENMSGDTNPLEMSLQEQYERLIYNPTESAFQGLRQPVVLCIDALDECVDTDALRQLLDAIASHRPSTALKFFVTSRPEYKIKERIEHPTNFQYYHSLRLHDIEQDIVERDISLYVSRKLGEISDLTDHYGDAWPPPEVEKIIKHSGTLFIVAATMVRYIGGDGGDTVERFESCGRLDAPESSSTLEDLYRGILEKAFAVLLKPAEKDDLHACLCLLTVLQKPMMVEQYAGLMCRRVSRIEQLLRPLHSVVDARRGFFVSIYHASFVDYLTKYYAKVILPPPEHYPWTVDRIRAHAFVAKLCLDLMESDDAGQGLFLGVSGAGTSYRSNDDQPSPLALKSELAYACAAWGEHVLAAAPIGDYMEGRIQKFLELRALYWIEALSVEKRAGTRSTEVLKDLAQIAQDKHFSQLLTDIRTFAGTFSPLINRSAPHLYLSALPFARSTLELTTWLLPDIPSIPVVRTSGGNARSGNRILVNVGSDVNCIGVSPDGTKVVSGDRKGKVRIWSTLSGEEIVPPLAGHRDSVNSVAFSLDGSRIVSGSSDKTIRIWDAGSGKPAAEPLVGHTDWVKSVAFSPDGSKIISGSDDNTTWIWHTGSGKCAAKPLEGHTNWVISVAFSPDRSKIVSGSGDRTIRIWDAGSGKLAAEPLVGHTDVVNSVAFSPDGSKIVSGSSDKTIRIWDARSGKPAAEPLVGHTDVVNSVTFSPDGSKIVSGSDDNTIRIWDAGSGKLAVEPLVGHTDWVRSVSFSPDGSKVVSGSRDNTIRIWDAVCSKRAGEPLVGHAASVDVVAFSPDGSQIVSGSYDKIIRIWDAGSGKPTAEPLVGHTDWVRSVALSPDGSKIVSGSDDKTIRIWDAQSGKPAGEPLVGHTDVVNSVAFSPDGSQILSGSGDYTIRIWDTGSGKPVAAPLVGHTDWVRSVAFSPDGSKIVSGSDDNTIRIWDAGSGKLAVEPLVGHTDWVRSVSFSPDGSKVVSGSRDSTIRIWDAVSGKPAGEPLVAYSSEIASVAFSPDGSKLASGCEDSTVRIWDVGSGEPAAAPLVGHTDWVRSVAFSPDGSKVVSGSDDTTIRIWDLVGNQTASPVQYIHHYPSHSLHITESGWICNAQNDLLLWVPLHLRSTLHIQPLQYIIGGALTDIDLTNAIYHGKNWRRCHEPRREDGDDGERWPVEF